MSEHHPGAQTPQPYPPELGPHNPNPTAPLLYEALRATALLAAEARGYAPGVAFVTVHVPLEVVALSLGRHRVTIWRAAKKLRALGLVDSRPHVTTAPGISAESVNVRDGTLWCVRLDPDGETPAQLTREELKHEWRDLAGDRARGRTAHRTVQERRAGAVQQSEPPAEGEYDLELLRAWALHPQPVEPTLQTVARPERADLEAVLDVPGVAREGRNAMVEAGAQALSWALRDPGGRDFYRKLLWQLLRHADRAGDGPVYFYPVYLAAQRALTDTAEGFARRPGALFTSRLKAARWYDEVMRGPPVRVGTRPAPI